MQTEAQQLDLEAVYENLEPNQSGAGHRIGHRFVSEHGHSDQRYPIVEFDIRRKQIGLRPYASQDYIRLVEKLRGQLESLVSTIDPKIHRTVQLLHGLFAIVDSEDLNLVAKRIWRPSRLNTSSTLYAVAGNTPTITMHSMIIPTPEKMVVDHLNRCGLDNRRQNFRIASFSLNKINQPAAGCCWIPQYRKWRATAVNGGKAKHLGLFKNKEDGEAAYREFRISRGEILP